MIVKKQRKDYNENCYARNKKGGVLFFGDFVTCVTKNMKEG
ncbi:hypothetical protein C2W63_00212 [Bacillus velezensis]|nr:hypothetical protein C2W63_00212 [Bacillus velezensis]